MLPHRLTVWLPSSNSVVITTVYRLGVVSNKRPEHIHAYLMDSGKLEYSDKLPTPNQLCRYDFHMLLRTHTHTQPFNGSWSGTTRVGRYQKKHSPTLTHPIHQRPPFTTIHSILSVQFTCLTVLFDNLSPGPFWSSSWSSTFCFILRAFLHPIIIFSQHMPIPNRSRDAVG